MPIPAADNQATPDWVPREQNFRPVMTATRPTPDAIWELQFYIILIHRCGNTQDLTRNTRKFSVLRWQFSARIFHRFVAECAYSENTTTQVSSYSKEEWHTYFHRVGVVGDTTKRASPAELPPQLLLALRRADIGPVVRNKLAIFQQQLWCPAQWKYYNVLFEPKMSTQILKNRIPTTVWQQPKHHCNTNIMR